MVTYNKFVGADNVLKNRDKVSELAPKKRSYYATGTDEKGRSYVQTDLDGSIIVARQEAKKWASKNKLTLDGVFGMKK